MHGHNIEMGDNNQLLICTQNVPLLDKINYLDIIIMYNFGIPFFFEKITVEIIAYKWIDTDFQQTILPLGSPWWMCINSKCITIQDQKPEVITIECVSEITAKVHNSH